MRFYEMLCPPFSFFLAGSDYIWSLTSASVPRRQQVAYNRHSESDIQDLEVWVHVVRFVMENATRLRLD